MSFIAALDAYVIHPTGFQLILLLGMVIALTASCVIDLQEKILPDIFTLITAILGLVLAFTQPFYIEGVGDALIGGAVGLIGSYAFRAGVFAIKKVEPMGLGDVKLFGAIGLWVGVQGVVSVALLGSLLTLLAMGIYHLITRKGSINAEVPFGPGIALGFLLTLLFGPIDRYLNPLL
ncbi:MAG: prepilin peptidase, partial [Dongiaceae bacterium]